MNSKSLLFPGFGHTSVPAFDVIFSQLESYHKALVEIEQERAAAKRRIEKDLGLTTTIKKAEAEDIVTAVMLCYSTSCGGDLGQLDFSVSRTKPFLHVRREALVVEFRDIAEAWDGFVEVMITLAEKLRRLYETAGTLTCELRSTCHSALFERVESQLENSNLSRSNALRSLSRIKQNMATSMDFLKQLRDTYRAVSSFQHYCDSLLEGYTLEEKLKFVKEAGRCACESGVVDRKKLVEEFYLAGEDFVV